MDEQNCEALLYVQGFTISSDCSTEKNKGNGPKNPERRKFYIFDLLTTLKHLKGEICFMELADH